MRHLWIILFLLVIAPVQAEAQELEKPAFCSLLPDAQLGDADYKPGVDVRGKSVVSADLNAIKQPVYDPVVIPIEVDLVQQFGLVNVPAGVELKPQVASLAIYQDGRVDYNGQDIRDQAYGACELQVPEQKSNGQQGADDLGSKPEIGDAVIVKPLTVKEVILEGGSE